MHIVEDVTFTHPTWYSHIKMREGGGSSKVGEHGRVRSRGDTGEVVDSQGVGEW